MKHFIKMTAVLALIGITQATLFEHDFDNSVALTGPMQLKTGDELRLVLNENLSTGYQWAYQTNEESGISADEAIFTVVLDEHHAHRQINADGV